jgi:hypothetical protein
MVLGIASFVARRPILTSAVAFRSGRGERWGHPGRLETSRRRPQTRLPRSPGGTQQQGRPSQSDPGGIAPRDKVRHRPGPLGDPSYRPMAGRDRQWAIRRFGNDGDGSSPSPPSDSRYLVKQTARRPLRLPLSFRSSVAADRFLGRAAPILGNLGAFGVGGGFARPAFACSSPGPQAVQPSPDRLRCAAGHDQNR